MLTSNCMYRLYINYNNPQGIFGTFLTLSLRLMQWYVTSVIRGSLYEKFGNKCVKILKLWRTELSYAQSKNRSKKMRFLRMDTCPSLNDIMEIRCNKCTRSEQGYDFCMPCIEGQTTKSPKAKRTKGQTTIYKTLHRRQR